MKTRHFGGKLSGFATRQEANFQKAHLNAYLHGHKQFQWGKHPENNEPMWWKVLEVWE